MTPYVPYRLKSVSMDFVIGTWTSPTTSSGFVSPSGKYCPLSSCVNGEQSGNFCGTEKRSNNDDTKSKPIQCSVAGRSWG